MMSGRRASGVKDAKYYDSLAWEVQIERDVRADGSIYYVARHPEFGTVSGPLGTGASPEEALAELREARRSLIAVLLERGDPIPEPRPVRAVVM
jgi:predicted RNase H-like HicB family nuclease